MFKWPWQRLRNKNKDIADNNETEAKTQAGQVSASPDRQTQVSARLQDNLDYLQRVLGQSQDIVFRSFNLGAEADIRALIIYIENMVNKDFLQSNILKPLMYDSLQSDLIVKEDYLHDQLLNSMLAVANVTEAPNLKQVVGGIFSGLTVLIVDGLDTAFIIDIIEHTERDITEPDAEVLVRGPREGFTETLDTNIVMVRRRLKSPQLKFEFLDIGRVSATKVSIVYLQGIALPDMVNEVRERLGRIDIDGILESGYLEEFIEDQPFSPFPQILHTERPERVAGMLLEGRIAIFTDGTPIVLVVPVGIASFLMSPEDYYERYMFGTPIRWLRYISFALSILLPSLYIAITTFHQEMIPTTLLISIASFRMGVPFSTLTEALLMEFIFEVLREAGIRLPRFAGQAVSIVGALVIGQAAVQAGLVSPLMVIVVAGTGIASFTFPAYNLALALRLLRFPLMLLAGTLGLFGVMFGIIMISIHAAGLRSFGLPYLSSLAPLHLSNLKDILIRAPWWAMDDRPAGISKLNRRRQAMNLKPSAPGSQSPAGQQRSQN